MSQRQRQRPSVSTRPIGENQIEVRTRCPHGGYRIGFQLGETVTQRVAVCTALFHHYTLEGCECMRPLWPKYRTEHAPADIDGMRERFERLWAGVEQQQRQYGYAVVDWAAAVRSLAGEGAA